MFTAMDSRTRKCYSYRTVSGLVRQAGGNDYQIEHETVFDPPRRTLMILRCTRYGNAIVTTVRVDAEELAQATPRVEW